MTATIQTPFSAISAWEADATPTFDFMLLTPTPSNNEVKNMHFHAYKQLRRDLRALVQSVLPAERLSPAGRQAFLVVDRSSAGTLDWDNAYGGLTPLLDCLVSPSDRNPDGLGLTDDSPKYMLFPPLVSQYAAKRGQGSTRVRIYHI